MQFEGQTIDFNYVSKLLFIDKHHVAKSKTCKLGIMTHGQDCDESVRVKQSLTSMTPFKLSGCLSLIQIWETRLLILDALQKLLIGDKV